ncbi:MAG: translesion error-prone DNA polymerase V autoproteolytic subunit [Paraglaciecola sp.]|uniref:translesion error-prone DNA polymerase V autoproteolytic subunit n=1 Tax=Paraglaciecola sp. TaxID=1920173 RepID=UPI00273DFDEA|nr:translesion error-prone DNA polymerase V autoproteolytic subunit [Paraglaciecola sp.]MDP5031430.1 translesion error-prone DNA polymerase V autoproteolytic subunit [Paraglaciecola sp.]MDP5132482.1 translesion error-prone DNA polymerase V autoproteolytic subunit [Paraglaciecola sp.]
MSVEILGQAELNQPAFLPLYGDLISAGFPSPAQDYVEQTLDLNELCIRHPAATFLVRVSGDSMKDKGILDGDVLVVDRSVNAVHGSIIIAALNREFTVKELCLKPVKRLLPHNKAYQPIPLTEQDEFEVFGVVVSVVRKMVY